MRLPINSKRGLISHRLWDAATYWLKIANFPYPSLILCPRLSWPFSNFWKGFTDRETRVLVFEVADGEDFEILARVILIEKQSVTNGQTDPHTDRRLTYIH